MPSWMSRSKGWIVVDVLETEGESPLEKTADYEDLKLQGEPGPGRGRVRPIAFSGLRALPVRGELIKNWCQVVAKGDCCVPARSTCHRDV